MGNELYDTVKAEVEALIAKGKALVADGLQFRDVVPMMKKVYTSVVLIAETVEASNEDKKALAVQIVDEFYADVIRPIQLLPDSADWFERLMDEMMGQAIHLAAEQAIDTLVELFSDEGWQDQKGGL